MEASRQAGRQHENAPRAYRRPVIPLLVALMVGIAAGAQGPGHPAVAWAAVAAGLGRVIARLTRGRSSALAPLALLAAVGYLSIQPWTAPRLPPHHVSRYTGPERRVITGTIAGTPIPSKQRTRFTLRAEMVTDADAAVAVVGLLRVSVAHCPPGLADGQRVRLVSRLRAPRNFNNPGRFDYRRHLALAGIRATAFARGDQVTVLAEASAAGGRRFWDGARSAVARLIDRAVAAPDSRALLKALVLGDRSQLSAQLRERFARSGASHVLAISGLHVGVVAAAAFWLLRALLSFFPALLWRAAVRKWAALLALIPVTVYGLLAGMAPSTQRAVLMVAVFMATVWFCREQDPLNTLALAALAILGVHPPALFSVSFQLSFAAVAAIVLGAARRHPPGDVSRSLARVAVGKAGTFLAVSALATLGTLPLAMRTFNQVPLIGLLTNCIAVPAIGMVVVPLALISSLAGLLWPPAGCWGLTLCGGLLSLCLPVISGLADLPFAALKTVTPNLLEIAGYYLLLSPALLLIRRRAAGARFPHSFPAGRTAWVLAAAALVFWTADVAYWMTARYWHRDLRVTVLDVGQGSAAVVEFPGGHVMLVDGGGFSDPGVFDVGARIVAPFLWHKKIRTVDTLVLSHPDSDHLNGLRYIAEHFHVKRLWSTGEAADSLGYRRLMEIVRQRGIEHPEFRRLPRVQTIGGVRLEILHPGPGFAPGTAPAAPQARNDHSLALRLEMGRHAILLPGDLTARAEAELVHANGPGIASTVLVAPHHGSRTSSSETLLGAVRPAVVIVSAAADRSRHPHPEILARYAAAGAGVLRTASAGAVCVSLTSAAVRLVPFLADREPPQGIPAKRLFNSDQTGSIRPPPPRPVALNQRSST